MRLNKIVNLGLYLLLMGIMALPLFGFRAPKLLPTIWLLVIHEFSAFLFVGHTVFSNIWSMRIRQTQPIETGIGARAFIRRLATQHLRTLGYPRRRRSIFARLYTLIGGTRR